MRSPNNVLFTSAHAMFDEHMFPKCPDQRKRRNTRLLELAPKPDHADQHSHIPPGSDDDNESCRPPNNLPSKGQDTECDDTPTPPRERSPSPPPPPPEEPPAPRCSGHERKMKTRPGNVYGESRHSVEQYKEIEKQGA